MAVVLGIILNAVVVIVTVVVTVIMIVVFPLVETEEDAATVAELMVDLCIDVVKIVVVFVGIGVVFVYNEILKNRVGMARALKLKEVRSFQIGPSICSLSVSRPMLNAPWYLCMSPSLVRTSTIDERRPP